MDHSSSREEEESTHSSAVRIGWSIASVVGAFLLGFWLFGVSDLAGRLITGVLVVFVMAVAIFANATELVARSRTKALRRIAKQLRLQFAPDGQDRLDSLVECFHLGVLRCSWRLVNLMHGKINGIEAAEFDLEFTGAKTRICYSVIVLQRRGTKRPNFVLRPESGWWSKLASVFVNYQDINFESHPEFSNAYRLCGDNESAIRELFTDDVLNFYEKNPGLCTESNGDKLLVYYAVGRHEPDEIRSFLKDALQLLALLEPA